MLYHLINLAGPAGARAARLDRAQGRHLGPGGVVPQVRAVLRPGGLLAGQDVEAARRALMKTGGRRPGWPSSATTRSTSRPRVRRGPRRARGPAQAAAAAGHHAPVRRGAVRRAGPLGDSRASTATSWPGTTRAARTTRTRRSGEEVRAAAGPTRSPGTAAPTRSSAWCAGPPRPRVARASGCSAGSARRRRQDRPHWVEAISSTVPTGFSPVSTPGGAPGVHDAQALGGPGHAPRTGH